MKIILLLTGILTVLLTSNANAFCHAMKPSQPYTYCNSGWQAVCIEDAYKPLNEGYWVWTCQDKYGY